jgi:hypothetical protein
MGRIRILGADDSEFKWEAIPPPLRSSIMGMSVLRERGSIRAHGMAAAARMGWQMKNDRVNVQKMECCGDWARTSYRYGSKMNPPRPGDPLESITGSPRKLVRTPVFLLLSQDVYV